jgi:hypothetical protein
MNCDECGRRLVKVLGEETITTLEGETITFRRQSDYLLCRSCLKLYSIVELREQENLTPAGSVPDLSFFSELEDEGDGDGSAGQLQRRSSDIGSLEEFALTEDEFKS